MEVARTVYWPADSQVHSRRMQLVLMAPAELEPEDDAEAIAAARVTARTRAMLSDERRGAMSAKEDRWVVVAKG